MYLLKIACLKYITANNNQEIHYGRLNAFFLYVQLALQTKKLKLACLVSSIIGRKILKFYTQEIFKCNTRYPEA